MNNWTDDERIADERYKRLTEKTKDCFRYDLKDFKHKIGEFNDYDAFFAYSMAVKRLGELEDKIENGALIELPCVAYNVKECRYQIISTKNGRVYVSKFYRDRKEAEAKLKELQEEQKWIY